MILLGSMINMVGTMEVFKIIFFHELKILFKSRGRIFANILYFFIFSAIFQILSKNFDQNSHSQLFIINTVIALLTSIIAVNNDFLEKDFRDGSLEQIIIDCQNLEIFVIAKCLANWLSSSFFIALLASAILKINNFEILNFWQFFLALILSSLSLNFLLALCGSLSMLGGLSSMISIVAIPLSLPILIITSATISENYALNIKILLALTILIIAISSFACAKIIKIANN
jgi:heme exporter protein CcmB